MQKITIFWTGGRCERFESMKAKGLPHLGQDGALLEIFSPQSGHSRKAITTLQQTTNNYFIITLPQ
jgi:hypothetical protein